MEPQREKGSSKNNKNFTVATCNIDTDFMFIFIYLKEFKNFKFLTLLPSKM